MKNITFFTTAIKTFDKSNKVYTLFALLFCLSITNAQTVTVSGASGTAGPYTTLSAAFTAINGTAQTGNNILITISGTTTEPIGGAVLNQSSGLWTSLTINPTGGAAATIQGTPTAGLPLIDLNGADNVIIDGLNSGGNTLTISNLSNSTTNGTSTIRFINDASTNIIRKCNILSSSLVALNSPGGAILFSTTTGSTGNDSNQILSNNIANASTGNPIQLILSLGTAAKLNSDNIISANNIYDFYSTSNHVGINIQTNSDLFTISNNKIYQTTARNTSTANFEGIRISNTGSQIISGNIIGYASSSQTGVLNYTTTSCKVVGINIVGASTSITSTITNNTIAGITLATTSGASTAPGIFTGIWVQAGKLDITGNTIGIPSTGSISISSTTDAGLINGMYLFMSAGPVNIINNTISTIVTNSTSGINHTFNGIYAESSAGSANYIIEKNTIGGSLSGAIIICNGATDFSVVTGINLKTASTSTNIIGSLTNANIISYLSSLGANISTSLTGIFNQTSIMSAQYNNISNLTSAGETRGIRSTTSSTPIVMSNNIISNITTSASNGLPLVGIISTIGGTSLSIDNNFISNLSITGVNNSTYLRGISSGSGTAPSVKNNVIDGLTSSSTNNLSTVSGINLSGSGNYDCSNNTIKNISSPTTNISSGGSTALTGINLSSSGTASTINNNTISSINATTTGAFSITAAAIVTSSSSSGGTISKNRIYGLTNASTGANNFVAGFIPSGGNWTFSNNMISIINTNTVQSCGVFDTGLIGSRKYFYNSIYIDGNHAGTQVSSAFQFNSSVGSADIKNNIFVMKRTSGAKNYAIANLGGSFSGFTSNYNVLNCSVASTIGTNGTDKTLATWKIASSGDANSFSTVTNIVFTNVAIADLHIVSACVDELESKGITIAVTDDFDGASRSATPDIGADEFSVGTSTWNGSWSPSVPTGNTKLVFTSNYSSSGNLSGCSCNVASGNVVFNNPDALILLNELTVAAAPGATIKFNNNSSLVQTNDLAPANTGNITMERITPNIYRFDYTYWGSPVTLASNYTLGNLSPNTQYDKYYSWTPFVGAGGGNWNQESITTVMNPIKGYIVRGPNTYSYTPGTKIPYTANFLGTPNNGVISCPIYHGTYGPGNDEDSYNLLGNPYPCAVDAEKFLSNATNVPILDGTIYFWTHNSAISSIYPDPFYGTFTYNYNANDYASWNKLGGSGTTAAAATGGATPNGFIAAGQAFFTKSTDGAASGSLAIFNNSMRVSGNNSQFFRHSNHSVSAINEFEVNEKHRIWLNMTSTSSFNQILVGYLADATIGSDRDYDGDRFSDGVSTTFYSIIPNRNLVIQGRPLPFSDKDEVQIGYKSIIVDTLSFGIDHFDGLFDNQNIYIEDKLLNITHDLKQSRYNFTSDIGVFNDRFVIKYNNRTLANTNFDKNTSVIALIKNEKLIIKSETLIEKIEIFDVSGKLVKILNTKEKELTIDFTFSKGVYFAKTTLENGIFDTKKLIQ